MTCNLAPLRAFSWAQNRTDQMPVAIEHHDGLEPIFIVMCIKQPQLLVAVDRVKSVVYAQDDALRHVAE